MSDGATDRQAPTPTARANGVELGIETFGRDDDRHRCHCVGQASQLGSPAVRVESARG